ncbi:MAG: radical SAM protein [Planctomycetota bacterium]|jgi:putative pyruvate formate lyase activating enzyme
MTEFEQLRVWSDPAVAKSLGWYRAVAENRKPAKFRIARTVASSLVPEAAPETALREELDRLTPDFLSRLTAIRAGGSLGPPAAGASLLEVCRELVGRMLSHCNFCRWDCGVDRTADGKPGACKLAADTRVSTYFRHLGEELVYRGRRGSGTIFFTSCNMRCAFCQNGDISTDKDNGTVVDAETLATMAWLLRLEGCHNINWVGGDPTIHLHSIVEAIALLGGDFAGPSREVLAKALAPKADQVFLASLGPERAGYEGAFNVPMLWNSNFFMSAEAMKILRLLIDVWLPDFKFGPGRCPVALARTPRYWETVTGNLALIHAWGEDLTIRHLVMPGHVACCTRPVLEWIATHMPGVPVNVMDQYRPDTFCDPLDPKYDPRHAAMARRCTAAEVREAYRIAADLGVAYATVTHEQDRRRLWQ